MATNGLQEPGVRRTLSGTMASDEDSDICRTDDLMMDLGEVSAASPSVSIPQTSSGTADELDIGWQELFSRQRRTEKELERAVRELSYLRANISIERVMFQLKKYLEMQKQQQQLAQKPQSSLDDCQFEEPTVVSHLKAFMSREHPVQKLEAMIRNHPLNRKDFISEAVYNLPADQLLVLMKKFQAHDKMARLLPPDTSFGPNYVPARQRSRASVERDLEDAATADALQCHVKDLMAAVDSDATASSSDEEKESSDSPCMSRMALKAFSKSTPVKGSLYDWLSERSWLCSRWQWLQAQVADLEYKIRQSVEICRCLKSQKSPSVSPSPTFDYGFVDSSLSAGCARCRPASSISKRYVIKASRILGARFPHLDRVSEFQCMTMPERHAYLDLASHAVLSRRRGLKGYSLYKKLSAYREGSMDAEDQLTKRMRQAIELRLSSVLRNQREPIRRASKSLFVIDAERTKRHYSRRFSFPVLSEKKFAGFKFRNGREKPSFHHTAKRSRSSSQNSLSNLSRRTSVVVDTPATAAINVVTSLKDELSPLSSPSPRLLSSAARHKAAVTQNFDFGDVVMDPKAAPIKPVQKLQYKEIMTPAWRKFDWKLGSSEESEEEVEDVSDEAVFLRHLPMESNEKKRDSKRKPSESKQNKRHNSGSSSASNPVTKPSESVGSSLTTSASSSNLMHHDYTSRMTP